MKQVWTRFAEAKDDAEFTNWVHAAQAINLFDPAVMSYPTTKTLVAERKDPKESLVYMPVQTVLMMESLAPKPGIAPIDEALALRELTKGVALLASQQGIKEQYFICHDARVIKFASAHGYEILPWTLMRLKV